MHAPPTAPDGAFWFSSTQLHEPVEHLVQRGLRSADARAFNAPLYLLSYLGKLIWRPVRESNPRLPARQAGTLAPELTKH